MSLYDDLGIQPDASEQDITAAYRRAAKRSHPDHGGDPEQFERVRTAGLVLRDPARRAKYDRDGAVEDEPDNLQAAMAGLLVSCFQEALSKGGASISQTNMVAAATTLLRDRLAKLKAERSNNKAIVKKLDGIIARLSVKPGVVDFVGNSLRQDRALIEDAARDNEKMIAACEAAIEFAANYSWRKDQSPASSTFQFIDMNVVAGP